MPLYIQSHIENDKNTLEQARYTLLTRIGLDPATQVKFLPVNINQLIAKYHVPDVDHAQRLTLANDINYQIAQITLHGALTRAMAVASDNTRAQLNLILSGVTGNSTVGGKNAGINSLINGVNMTNSATLDLTIPIDDVQANNTSPVRKLHCNRRGSHSNNKNGRSRPTASTAAHDFQQPA